MTWLVTEMLDMMLTRVKASVWVPSLTSCQITDTNMDSHARCTLVVASEVDTQPGDITRESRVDTWDGPIRLCAFVGVN